MSDFTIPVIELDILNYQTPIIDISITSSFSPFSVEVGMTMPGPQGPGPEIYYSDLPPDDSIGNDGAIWVQYVG